MELEPTLAPPSERTARWLLAISAALIAGLSSSFALDMVHAAETVTLAVTVMSAVFLVRYASRASWLPLALSLGATYALAFTLHDHAGRDATAAAGGTLLAVLLVRPLVRAQTASAHEGALDRFECIALTAGRSLFVVGILGLVSHLGISRAASVFALAASLGLLAVAMWRDRARVRFLTRVYAKGDASYRIERDSDVRGYELLPPVLSGMITDAVIARVSAGPATYRTSDGPRPLARVTASLPKMLGRVEKRMRMAGTIASVLLATLMLVVITPFESATHANATVGTTINALPVAPACRDARAYFSERLESEVDGVGRATLLTSAQDPTLGASQGVILVVPSSLALGVDTRERVLALAKHFPCSEPLTLSVEEPAYRHFTLEATLTLDARADEASVLRDADTQVHELFKPDARAVFNEHVTFGDAEKTLGYRVRHALRHVFGVESVRLLVNGSDKDVPLAPRDYPMLQSLTLHAAR